MASVVKINFPVQGMSCASCAVSVESMLNSQPGVKSAVVNFAASTVWVEYDEQVIDTQRLREAVRSIGYDLITNEVDFKKQDEFKRREITVLKRKTIFAALLALPVVFIGMFLMDMPYANWIMFVLSTPVVFWFGRGFYVTAFKQLKRGKTNMDTLVAMSTGIAYFFSLFNTLFPHYLMNEAGHAPVYFEASSVIIVFILLGRFLEEKAKANTSSAIKKLMGLAPDTVTLIGADGAETVQSVSVVQIGNLLRVKPGDRIPVDGVVVEGISFVDESSITGEPVPSEKMEGSTVFAGTINQKGSFSMEARKVGSETLLARIIRMVQEAQGSKPPVQKLVDKVASVFVPVVMILSVITFIVWMVFGKENVLPHALLAMVSVLIIACPCALGLATPTAIMVGIGRGAESGILIKDADGLELAHTIDTLVLDKTGTITEGKPVVTDWIWLTEKSEEMKQVLFGMEMRSEHPLAESIVAELQNQSVMPVAVKGFRSKTGRGVTATFKDEKYVVGNELLMSESGIEISSDEKTLVDELQEQAKTVLYFGSGNRVLAVVAITDPVKPTSKTAIRKLKEKGIDVYMLTGDNEPTARSVALQTGILHYKAGLLPAEKAAFIQELQSQKRIVAMAGDGINDSQAMAQADVSIAMGSGADIAMDVAKMTFVSSSLESVLLAMALSTHTIRTVRQNLFWAFIYNLIAIPVAAGVLFPFTGFMLNPMIAGAAMAMSSVSVVSNSLRLKYVKLDK